VQRWEYMTWLVHQMPKGRVQVVGAGSDRDAYASDGSFAAALDQAGKDGWELVNATQGPEFHTLFFKRSRRED
jgi:hypothetical protein